MIFMLLILIIIVSVVLLQTDELQPMPVKEVPLLMEIREGILMVICVQKHVLTGLSVLPMMNVQKRFMYVKQVIRKYGLFQFNNSKDMSL